MGFQARVIVWDLATMDIKYELVLHKKKIQSLCFSPGDKYLATLGGEDDNKLVLWDMATGEAICGSSAANDSANIVKFYNNDAERLVTAGKYHIRSWQVDRQNRKMRPSECKLGSIKRVVNTVCIDSEDKFIYAGTLSGDVVCINAETHLFRGIGPRKKPFGCGVREMTLVDDATLLVACGDGTLAVVGTERLSVRRKMSEIKGRITSLQLNKERDHFFVGTDKSTIHCVCFADFEHELRASAHYQPIHCAVFPPDTPSLFVTAANDIRVWNRKTLNELLRIQIPNIECRCVAVSTDGKMIVSGWTDGKIRANLPQSGRLMWAINNAHMGNINCVKITRDGSRVASAGDDGKVRVWKVSLESQILVASWKEHHGPVEHLELNEDDSAMISASHDGSCIVWDLTNYHRINALFAQNQFTSACYHPDQSQILTTGSDRKISWWCATDLEAIRITEGSDKAIVNALAISPDGEHFASCGGDEKIKLWRYDEGEVSHIGRGHSGAVTSVCIAPDARSIVSAGTECGIFIWDFPQN